MIDPKGEAFRWRGGDDGRGHDDADAADDRLVRQWSTANPPARQFAPPYQPLGDPTAGLRNQISQHRQVADAQRRRAARLEARLGQLREDVAWFMLGAALVGFGVGFGLAWAIVRRVAVP